MRLLIITNGDAVRDALGTAFPEATVLPWRDALHEGPVRDLPAADFRRERAAFLARGTSLAPEAIAADMGARDALVAGHAEFDRVELWFEHDLYDQLQLVQVVDMLWKAGRTEDVAHITSPRHLGPMSVDQLAGLTGLALPVNAAMAEAAARAWAALCHPTPEGLAEARRGPIAGFPFLGQALTRLLQELPGPEGLSRTERQILYSIDRGVNRPGPLFARVLNMEEAAFLGDWSFFRILGELAYARVPLVTGLSERFEPVLLEDDARRKAFITAQISLTTFGADVLAGRADLTDHNAIDRWVGGTHLTNDNLWRWDDEAAAPVPPGRACA